MKIKTVQNRSYTNRNEHQSHVRKRPNDFRRPDVPINRDSKHFRREVGQYDHRENFQTTRPANPAAIHRLLSPFARINRLVRK